MKKQKGESNYQYLVWTIVNSDSEIDRDEVAVSMAESQENWQVSKRISEEETGNKDIRIHRRIDETTVGKHTCRNCGEAIT